MLYITALGVVIACLQRQPKYRAMMKHETKGRVLVGQIEMNEYNIAGSLFDKVSWLVLVD